MPQEGLNTFRENEGDILDTCLGNDSYDQPFFLSEVWR